MWWTLTTLLSGRSELDEKGEYYSKNHPSKDITTKWDKCSEREEHTHKKASHKRIWKGRWAGGAKAQGRRDHGRSGRRSGWTPQNTSGEQCACILLWAFQSHIYFTNLYGAHGLCTGLYQALQIQQEQSRYDPCSCKSFQQILQRGTTSWMRIYSLSFVTCCPTAHFGVWSALLEAICVLGEQTPQISFLTKSGSLAQHRSSLTQSEMLGSRSCLGPEGCHILTDPHVQIWQS